MLPLWSKMMWHVSPVASGPTMRLQRDDLGRVGALVLEGVHGDRGLVPVGRGLEEVLLLAGRRLRQNRALVAAEEAREQAHARRRAERARRRRARACVAASCVFILPLLRFRRGRVGSASGAFGGSGNAAAGNFGSDAAESCTTAAAGVRAFLSQRVFCVLMPPRALARRASSL